MACPIADAVTAGMQKISNRIELAPRYTSVAPTPITPKRAMRATSAVQAQTLDDVIRIFTMASDEGMVLPVGLEIEYEARYSVRADHEPVN